VDAESPLSISHQCRLLGVSRSSLYYSPVSESSFNLALMRRIDELHLDHPFAGSRMLSDILRTEGYVVNRKRIRRLMRVMGIEAHYPKRNISKAGPEHQVFPYLLRGLDITHPNQVWSIDITYIPLATGFLYLVAVLDWFSRYVLSWRLSNSLANDFCCDALESALANHGRPTIFNSDQGVQFTARNFVDRLLSRDIQVSMDGRGRAIDNIFIERLWRSVKYESVYIRDYSDGRTAFENLTEYFRFYNYKRPHSSLGKITPSKVYRCT